MVFDEPLQNIFKQADANLDLFKNELKLNMAYAQITQSLKKNPAQDSGVLIKETFEDFSIKIEESLNYKSLFQLMSLLYNAAKQRSDYFVISHYMTSLFEMVLKKSHLAEKHIYYHMSILDLMANTYFRNRDFAQSMQLTRELETQMETNGNRYKLQFTESVLLLKALNFNYTGHPENAILVLEESSLQTPNSQLSHVVVLFQQKKFKEAYTIFKTFQHSDQWYEKKLDLLWVIKKSIIEILLLIELDNVDLVYQRITSFQKRFSSILKKLGEQRVINFMKRVKEYYNDPKTATTEAFKDNIEQSFEWKPNEDIFVISFYAWLKAKMSQRNIYTVTLELVNTKNN